MKPSVHNIDARFGGDCTVLTTLCAEYTVPPLAAQDRTTGFDGVVVLDVGMDSGKVALARDCAVEIVQATGSNDRLALVTMATEGISGEEGATVVSELIMCTTPYKQALQQSIRRVKATSVKRAGDLSEAMRLALGLLGADSRYGGHIFVLSDGNSSPPLVSDDPGFWTQSPSTVHCIAVGGLVDMTVLTTVRTREGCLMEFRDTHRDASKVQMLVGYLGMNVYSKAIETVRCRFAFPEDKVSVNEMQTHPPHPSDSSSVTISPPQTHPAHTYV